MDLPAITANDQGPAPEFVQAVGAALNVAITSARLGPAASFTKLAPG